MSDEPKKMGRPATGMQPRRSIRVSPADWKTIQDAAAKAGQTASAWIRETLLRRANRSKQ